MGEKEAWVSITSDDFEQMEKRMGDPFVSPPELEQDTKVVGPPLQITRLQYVKDEKKRRNERRRQRKARKAGRKKK